MNKSTRIKSVYKVVAPAVVFLITGLVALPADAGYRGYEGELVSLSHSTVYIAENAGITIDAVFKNTGTKTWKNSGKDYVSLNVARPFFHMSEVAHPFWTSEYQPGKLVEMNVAPGENGTLRFALRAPATNGMYTEHFMLSSEGIAWMRETEFSITLVVGEVAVQGITSGDTELSIEEKILQNEIVATTTSESSLIESTITLEEPLIRVGLYKTVEPVIITANTFFDMENASGGIVYTFNPGEKVVTFFDDYSNTFYVSSSGLHVPTPYAKFSSNTTSTIFTITNFENPSKWQTDVNDNRFKGSVEIRFGEKSDSPWVINELLLEDYLKGIKETSQVSPAEYQKAIAIAARSYALWHYLDNKKHAGNNFTVDAVWDQVYRGANTETLIPSFSEAVDETHGTVITYDDEVAFTTYFAQSDGRTRNSQQVWGGAYHPWLVSVADPTNEGLRLWGHGVGMSARGALIMASRYGSTVDEILKHYYTGVTIEIKYERGVVPIEEIVLEN
jgi:hypothetical protein